MSRHAPARQNLYLVGFMGTGKTTIGRELARLMGRKFVDVDQEIEKKFAMPVSEIFAQHGESAFRGAEEEVALGLAGMQSRIVATGGGTILNPRIYQAFENTGVLVCLFTQKDDLVDRLARTDKRPLLRGQSTDEIGARVERLLEERRSVYEQVSIRVDTTQLTPLTAARKIHETVGVRLQMREALGKMLDAK